MNLTDALRSLYEISLKIRVLREYEKANTPSPNLLSDRDLLALELISTFSLSKEKQLGRVLGIQTSALTELINRLVERGYIIRCKNKFDKRERSLQITEEGRRFFVIIKRRSARRYIYLFGGVREVADAGRAKRFLQIIEKNITRQMKEQIFGDTEDTPPEEWAFDQLFQYCEGGMKSSTPPSLWLTSNQDTSTK